MTIAVVQALLVTLYLMHLRHGSGLTKISVVAGVFWFLILIVLTFSDYLTRGPAG